MRRILSILICISIILSVSVNSFAENGGITAKAVVDMKAGKVLVSGTYEGADKEIPVSMLALNPNTTKADIPKGNALFYMDDTKTDDNGAFSFEFDYVEGEGNYKVYLSAEGMQTELEFSGNYSNGLGNIYGLTEEYAAGLENADTKTRFLAAKAELPSEMPVYVPVKADGGEKIYVSPNADESGDGSFERPLKTLKEAIAKVKSSPSGKVIFLREGIHQIGETELRSICANDGKPLIISAYADENVVVTGGESFDGSLFEKVTDERILSRLSGEAKENVRVIDLKKYSSFADYGTAAGRTLSVNGAKYRPARYPDSENTSMREYKGEDGENGVIDSGTILNPSGSMCGNTRYTAKDTTKKGFEICVEDIKPFTWEEADDIWISGRLHTSWSLESDMIESINPERRSLRTVYGTNNGVRYFDGNSFYYYNVLEELTLPGEYCLDKNEGKLYIYPAEELSGAEVSLSFNEEPKLVISDCRNIIFNGIKFQHFTAPYCFEIENAENIRLQNLRFENMNGGVKISGDSRYCGVINSVFKDLESENAPYIISSPAATSELSVNLVPQYNYLQNNYFYNCYAAVIRGTGNIASHNSFLNSIYAALSIDQARECVIEYNTIENAVRKAVDMGAIYLSGMSRGAGANHIRYNYINHCNTERDFPVGIYLDEFMSRSYVYGNILNETVIYLNNGSENAIVNNIIAGEHSSNPVICIANYIKPSTDAAYEMWNREWKNSVLSYGGHTQFLNPENKQEYINVLGGAYAKRYPTLKDFAEKMYKRIGEYQRTGNDLSSYLTAVSKGGAEYNLDTYLRSPRYNYYGANAFVNSSKDAAQSANEIESVSENNKMIIKSDFGADSYSSQSFYNDLNSQTGGFETIDFENIGVIEKSSDNLYSYGGYEKLLESEKAKLLSPADFSENIPVTAVSFEWQSSLGAEYYNLKVSENSNFSKSIIDITTSDTIYYADKTVGFEENKTYYWQVTVKLASKGYSVGELKSDIYSFKINSNPSSGDKTGITPIVIKALSGAETEDISGLNGFEAEFYLYNLSEPDNSRSLTLYAGGYLNGMLTETQKFTVNVPDVNELSEKKSVIFGKKADSVKLFLWNELMPASGKKQK